MRAIKNVLKMILNLLIVATLPVYLGFSGKHTGRGMLVLAAYAFPAAGIVRGYLPAYIISGVYLAIAAGFACYLTWKAVREMRGTTSQVHEASKLSGNRSQVHRAVDLKGCRSLDEMLRAAGRR